MNSAKRPAEQQEPQQETWPQKLNKALIAIGVIAFGLIITDRVIEMFSADDVPAVQAEVERVQAPEVEAKAALSTATENDTVIKDVAAVPASAAEPAVEEVAAAAVDQTTEALDEAGEQSVDLQDIFGSRVVFVSASEPVYVITEDDRRFEVGSEIDEQTKLAGVTAQQLILENAGGITVISLPDPIVQ